MGATVDAGRPWRAGVGRRLVETPAAAAPPWPSCRRSVGCGAWRLRLWRAVAAQQAAAQPAAPAGGHAAGAPRGRARACRCNVHVTKPGFEPQTPSAVPLAAIASPAALPDIGQQLNRTRATLGQSPHTPSIRSISTSKIFVCSHNKLRTPEPSLALLQLTTPHAAAAGRVVRGLRRCLPLSPGGGRAEAARLRPRAGRDAEPALQGPRRLQRPTPAAPACGTARRRGRRLLPAGLLAQHAAALLQVRRRGAAAAGTRRRRRRLRRRRRRRVVQPAAPARDGGVVRYVAAGEACAT